MDDDSTLTSKYLQGRIIFKNMHRAVIVLFITYTGSSLNANSLSAKFNKYEFWKKSQKYSLSANLFN